MRKTAIFGILILFAVLVMPTASAHVTLYFDSQDNNNSCGNTTYVRVMANITSPDDLKGGQFGINTNGACINITDVQPGPDILSFTWSWNAYSYCWDDDHDMIMYGFTSVQQPGVVEICNLSIYCNCSAGGYCTSPLNFSCGAAGCGSCPMEVLNDSTYNLYPASTTLENGTVTCGDPPEAKPDLVVDIIDPKYIFAGMNNSLFATVTNQGTKDTGLFVVNVDIRNVTNAQLFNENVSCQLNGGCSTDLHLPELFLGYWTPDTPENITINVTADYYNTEIEDNETNNSRVEYRNYTGDCKTDTMLDGCCYGYAGDHPLSEVYNGTGGVIYTIGDHVSYAQIANFTIGSGGDTNQVDGGIADIPDNAQVKKATLYVHYGWRSNAVSFDDDPTADFEMSIDGGSRLTPENYYTDCKNFSTSYTYYQYGAMVYDVTDNVTGDGAYQVVRSNYASGKGSTYSMSLMVTYNCTNCSTITYSVAHGYDRLATLYWRAYGEDRWWYYVSPEDATTTATLPDVDTSMISDSNWFTVAIDTDGTTGGEYQKINDCTWDAGAWLKDAGSYLAFNRTSNCISAAGIDEVVSVQERWKQSGNGFGLVFACLTTREKTSVPTATGLGDANFSVDEGCIEDLTALNKIDVSGPSDGDLFPYGLFSFNITCLEHGATVNVTIELPGSNTPTYMKYNNTSGEWDDEVPYNTSTGVLTLQDGGPYDRDGVANGVISDPGGPLSGAVQVSIDPCPVFICADPACRTTVNITLSGISDYGSGTIDLCYDNTVVNLVAVGLGDSTYVEHNSFSCGGGGVCERISAYSIDGLDGDVIFANVTFAPAPGVTVGCGLLNLTVITLFDRNYTALQTVTQNCTICITESQEPTVTACAASPPVILNDTMELRPRVQNVQCTNITTLSVHITDATSVEEVYVNLTPILGAGHDEVRMAGPDGAMAGDWYFETNASYSRPLAPYCLNVSAVDPYDNWNNDTCITLEVRRRGDINLDNLVDMADFGIISQYTVGLRPAPDECLAGVVPADSWDGVNMADALFIAMYVTFNPIPGYPAP